MLGFCFGGSGCSRIESEELARKEHSWQHPPPKIPKDSAKLAHKSTVEAPNLRGGLENFRPDAILASHEVV